MTMTAKHRVVVVAAGSGRSTSPAGWTARTTTSPWWTGPTTTCSSRCCTRWGGHPAAGPDRPRVARHHQEGAQRPRAARRGAGSRPRRAGGAGPRAGRARRGAALRHARGRGRRHALVLRKGPMGRVRPGDEDRRGRALSARRDPGEVRDGRDRHRSGRARRVADVRGDRRRADRGGAGRADRRAGAHGAAAGLPLGGHREARIILLEGAPAVLPPFAPKLQAYTKRRLEKMGVEVRLNTLAVDMDHESITVKGPQGIETIRAKTRIW